jgi:hypothetical protein
MKKKFDVILLEEVWEFFDTLDEKVKNKIIYNIDKSKYNNDPEHFKKLDKDIWEFRTKYSNLHIESLLFGIRRKVSRPWLSLHMELSRKQTKCQRKKLKRQQR